MPIYEFECGACGHRFDRLQRLSDDDPTICPTCQAEQLHRRVTAPSFRLAGSGWYETDFKKDGDKKRNLADAPSVGDGKSDQGAAPAPAAAPSPAPPPAAAPAPAAAAAAKPSGGTD